MRRKKHGAERLAACGELIVSDRADITGRPVELEIGCGKGKFICETALKHPDRSFIALEKIADVALLAAERVRDSLAGENPIKNVKFIVDDVANLGKYLGENEVSRIYLNFPDPWGKKGYYKRRLTYKSFIELYKTALVPGGEICFKTDNEALFDFSLGQLEENGFDCLDVTRDLHSSEYAEGDTVTEYETIFSEKGFKINRVRAVLRAE